MIAKYQHLDSYAILEIKNATKDCYIKSGKMHSAHFLNNCEKNLKLPENEFFRKS